MNRDLCYALNAQIEALAQVFIEKYFLVDDPELKISTYRVEEASDMLSYNCYINDYYFSIDDMYTALWYGIDPDTLFDWYDIQADPSNEHKINLKNYWLRRIGG